MSNETKKLPLANHQTSEISEINVSVLFTQTSKNNMSFVSFVEGSFHPSVTSSLPDLGTVQLRKSLLSRKNGKRNGHGFTLVPPNNHLLMDGNGETPNVSLKKIIIQLKQASKNWCFRYQEMFKLWVQVLQKGKCHMLLYTWMVCMFEPQLHVGTSWDFPRVTVTNEGLVWYLRTSKI